MTKPYFRSTPEHVPRRGSTSSKAGLDVPRRVAALEQGAGHKLAPSIYCASMYLENSGSPTHTSDGSWQKVSNGGGTDTWIAEYDYRPTDVAAQVDAATNKRINIKRSGLYFLTASTAFTSIADGSVIGTGAWINGVAAVYAQHYIGGTGGQIITTSGPAMLAAGDYVGLYALQSDTASEAYDTSSKYLNRLTVTLIGPPA